MQDRLHGVRTLKLQFARQFCKRAHCLWHPKSRWNSSLKAFDTLNIDKNDLKVKKLHPPKWGGVVSTKNYSQLNLI
jgi:hypothetical protein